MSAYVKTAWGLRAFWAVWSWLELRENRPCMAKGLEPRGPELFVDGSQVDPKMDSRMNPKMVPKMDIKMDLKTDPPKHDLWTCSWMSKAFMALMGPTTAPQKDFQKDDLWSWRWSWRSVGLSWRWRSWSGGVWTLGEEEEEE